jgi:lipoprotein-anchoring transpeptidase ErfK/SrfK
VLAVATFARPVASAASGLSPCDLQYPSDSSIVWTCHTLGRGESLESLFGDHWVDVARFNRIDRRHAVRGVRIKVPQTLPAIDCFTPMAARYAPADSDSQFVLVDLSEQYLGAYQRGRLVFSAPVAAGRADNPTPTGLFHITAYDRRHESSLYRVAETDRPYPMHFGLRFFVSDSGISYWIHGRDLPGVPASHGCIGLYDEAMQQECYGLPGAPRLADARWLFEWVAGTGADTTGVHRIAGPRLLIVGSAPGIRGGRPGVGGGHASP